MIEIQFPTGISKGAQGGPAWRVSRAEAASGFQQRNKLWANPLRRWSVGHINKDSTAYKALLAFWLVIGGPHESFRFKDWHDYSSDGQQDCNPATGDGSNDEFQIEKTYTYSANTYTRVIQKLVSGTVSVYVNGALQTETTDYTLDYDTGVITFGTPPTSGHTVKASYEFDVPAHFVVDSMDAEILHPDLFTWGRVDIEEERL